MLLTGRGLGDMIDSMITIHTYMTLQRPQDDPKKLQGYAITLFRPKNAQLLACHKIIRASGKQSPLQPQPRKHRENALSEMQPRSRHRSRRGYM